MESTQNYTTGALLTMLLLADLAIAVASWYIPADVAVARTIMAAVQMIFLITTAAVTVRWVVRDY